MKTGRTPLPKNSVSLKQKFYGPCSRLLSDKHWSLQSFSTVGRVVLSAYDIIVLPKRL